MWVSGEVVSLILLHAPAQEYRVTRFILDPDGEILVRDQLLDQSVLLPPDAGSVFSSESRTHVELDPSLEILD